MKLIAKAELIIDHNNIKTITDNLDIEDIELGEIEFDRRIVLNIREKAAMLIRLVDHSSDIDYSYPPRTKHEINGGYKIAKRSLKISETFEIYSWFYEAGYLQSVDKRIPNLKQLDVMDQVYILKESFVEDYRISLNYDTDNGTFILPNKFCYSGDFQKPDLLLEGVDIMRQMLRGVGQQTTKGSTHHREIDAICASRIIEKARKGSHWTPGTITMTEQDVKINIDKLIKNSVESQVAAGLSD